MIHFPFALAPDDLSAADLDLLAPHAHAIVRQSLPCRRVGLFAGTAVDGAAEPQEPDGVEAVRQQGRPVIDPDRTLLYLPLYQGDALWAVAELKGSDPGLWQRPTSWLADRADCIVAGLLHVKQCAVDPATKLPNGWHLRQALAFLEGDSRTATLLLIELYPRARDAERAAMQTVRAGAQLGSLVGNAAPLHHCGAGVFALLWPGAGSDEALRSGDAILRWAKREKFSRAHIGITSISAAERTSADAGPRAVPAGRQAAADIWLDQAWQALRAARQRGPYGLCTFEALCRLKDHPFSPPAASLQARLRRLWRRLDRFALILLHQDQAPAGDHFSQRVCAMLGPSTPVLPVNGREAFVLLADAGPDEALAWVADFKSRWRRGADTTFSMGIATFPFHDFVKSATPVNARKALRHTSFYGPDTATVFDAVSLNISGDVYYNEGDLSRAAKEYRKGLALAPANVNLLNSLGVTYAQMNRHQMAIPLFERAMELDAGDFMAPFNLGSALMERGEELRAIACFERALVIDAGHYDLLLQLGRLYCRVGRYEDAIKLLAKGENDGGAERGRPMRHGAGHYYLGQAYRELGRYREAIVSLQRALQYNRQDAAALSLLGELYSLEGEGDEIALSLCRQAVELDDGQWQHWYRLAAVQLRTGAPEAAVVAARESLRLARRNPPVALLLARIYETLGDRRQARRWYDTTMRLSPGLKNEARQGLRRLEKKGAQGGAPRSGGGRRSSNKADR